MPVGVIKLKNNIQFIYFITIKKRVIFLDIKICTTNNNPLKAMFLTKDCVYKYC